MKLQQLLNEKILIKDGRIVRYTLGNSESHFMCAFNKLTTLEGAPSKVRGIFDCSHNRLTSLEHCPTSIDEHFDCSHNRLTSLEHCPTKVGGGFDCSDNDLTSLEHGPTSISSGFDFNCSANQLTSLEGCPSSVREFYCDGNLLTSLEGCPFSVGSCFVCYGNQLTSLEGIHKIIKKLAGVLYAEKNPIKSHILGVFLIPGCKGINIDNTDVRDIVNKHLSKGRDGLIDCQNELIEAGFEDFAQI